MERFANETGLLLSIQPDESGKPIRSMAECDRWRESCLGILDGELVIPCPDASKWVEWMNKCFSNGDHLVEEDQVGGFHILTAFLGINQNVSVAGPPLWFETMVFRASADGNLGAEIKYETLRYSTISDALAGHCEICEKVKNGEIGE
jgi:hypothetical protein